MADRDVTADVVVRDQTGPGIDSASRRVKKFGDEVDRVNKRAEGSLKALSGKIGSGITDGLAKAVTGAGAGLAKLGVKAGADVASGIASSIQSAGPQVQGAISAVLVGAAITAAPLIAATIAGAVTSTAALGGLAVGIAAIAKDARIAAAGREIASRLLGALRTEAAPLIAPVLQALQKLQASGLRIVSTLGPGFASLARYVDPLVTSITKAGEAIARGLVASMQNAGPLILSIGSGIEKLGAALEESLTLFASIGPEAAAAFDLIFSALSGVITLVSKFIVTTVLAAKQVITLGGLLGDDSDKMNELNAATTAATTGINGFKLGLDGTSSSATSAAMAVQTLAQATALSGQTAVDQQLAQINLNNVLKQVGETREEGARLTDNESQALINLRGAIDQQAQAMANNGATATEVNAKVNELRNTFIAQARQMGLNQQQAEALAAEYGLFPRNVSTNVRLTGASEAERELERVRAKAGSIPAQVNIAIRVTGSTASRQAIEAALAKQSMSADSGFGHHAESFAAAAGFGMTGRMSGAQQRERPINVASEVNVMLDGRAIAPMARAIATQTVADNEWTRRRSKR